MMLYKQGPRAEHPSSFVPLQEGRYLLMKRLFMLLAVALMVVAAMALSGVAQAASPSSDCREKAESLTGKNLEGYFFVVGTADSNTFSPTNGRAEVFCGFGGGDRISHLKGVDIFIGGAGRDYVGTNNGTFYGGDDTEDDYVVGYYAGHLVNAP